MTLVALGIIAISFEGDLSTQEPRFVPGQALVKFRSASLGEAGVVEAGRTSPPDLQMLDPIIRDLESSLLLPLHAAQISSGNWLLLSLDQERLRERAVQQLRGRPGIADVQSLSLEADELGPFAVAVKFAPDSQESRTLAGAKAEERAAAIAELLSEMQQLLDLPLKGGRWNGDVLELSVDLNVLTHTLVNRLAQTPQIEAVNLNYILGAIGGGIQ
jgi:hypothetical protein